MSSQLNPNEFARGVTPADMHGKRQLHVRQDTLGHLLVNHRHLETLLPEVYPVGKKPLMGHWQVIIVADREVPVPFFFKGLRCPGSQPVDMRFALVLQPQNNAVVQLRKAMGPSKRLTEADVRGWIMGGLHQFCLECLSRLDMSKEQDAAEIRNVLALSIVDYAKRALTPRGIEVVRVEEGIEVRRRRD